jgi:hypothetical protein
VYVLVVSAGRLSTLPLLPQATLSPDERFAAAEEARKRRDHLYLTVWDACKGGSSLPKLRALIEEEKGRIWNQVRCCEVVWASVCALVLTPIDVVHQQEKRKFGLDDFDRGLGQTMIHIASWNGQAVSEAPVAWRRAVCC